MATLYHEIIYRPLLNALLALYNTVALQDLGLAIIILTLGVRLALFPLFRRHLFHSMKMQELQPKLKKIKEETKGNKEKEVEATMALFKEHGTNPFVLFGLTLVQFPILIGLFQIFSHGLQGGFAKEAYAFITVPEAIPATFFGLINLAEQNSIVVGLVALAQLAQSLLALPRRAPGEQPSKDEKKARWMALLGPAFVLIIFYQLKLPAAVGLYWIVTTLFSAGQQVLLRRPKPHG